MELTGKTTLLFPPDLYGRLASLAEQRHSSAGELVREACRNQYSFSAATEAERLAAVKSMAAMKLPVGAPEEMKRQYVAPYKPLPGF